MTSAEFHEFIDQIRPVLDPQQFLFAEVDGEAAGFCFGFPDWTPLFRSFNGKAGPLQIARLLLRAKHYDRAGLLSIGVRDAYRGRNIGQTLAATLYRRYDELGLRGVDAGGLWTARRALEQRGSLFKGPDGPDQTS